MDMNGMNQQPVYAASAQPEAPKSKGLAVASMVLGIVALVFSCCLPVVTFICALVGVILGAVSLAKKKGGKGMAIAGLVCCIIGLVPAVIITVTGTALLAEIGAMM